MRNFAPNAIELTAPAMTARETISEAVWNLWRVLRRRWLTLLLFCGLIFAASIAGIFLITPRYEATTLVKINPSQDALAAMDAQTSGAPDQNLIDTEVEVMKSREIARAVSARLKLQDDPEFTAAIPPRPASGASGMVRDHWQDLLAEQLLKGLTVSRQKATYVIQLKARSLSPEKAARIANAFADEYIRFSVGTRTGTAEQTAEFLARRLKTLGEELGTQDARVAELRANAGILEGSGGGSVLNQEMTPLSAQLATAQAEAAAAQANVDAARRQIAQGGIDAISGVLDSKVVADLRRQRAEVLREKGQVDAQFGPKFPEAIKIQQQLDQIDQQIGEEARRIINSLESQASSAAARAASLSAQLASLRGVQAQNTRAAVLADGLAKQADANRETYGRMAENLRKATSQARNTMTEAQIVEPASPPRRPYFPDKPMLMIAGLIGGLAVGIAVVFTQEMLTRGIRSAGEIEQRFHLPVIAHIPALSRAELSLEGRPLHPADTIVDKPITLYAEALRLIRSTLVAGEGGAQGKIVTLVSALPDEGKTNTTLSLARIMAMAGEKVLLIDGDLRRAGLSRMTGMQGGIGLAELIQGEGTVQQAIRADRVANLDILPVSKNLFTAEDLFSGGRMRGLLDRLAQDYDRILIDTPPVMGVADARTLATVSDVVLVVVRWNRTNAEVLEEVVVALRRDQSPLAGAVLTMVSTAADVMGPLSYSRRYQYYYQSE
jgi:succinoglycan biosynthesis transport protein ExoP